MSSLNSETWTWQDLSHMTSLTLNLLTRKIFLAVFSLMSAMLSTHCLVKSNLWTSMHLYSLPDSMLEMVETFWTNCCLIKMFLHKFPRDKSWSAQASTAVQLSLTASPILRRKSTSKMQTQEKVVEYLTSEFAFYLILRDFTLVMGVKGRRVHVIEEMSDTIISFQRGKSVWI